MTVFKLFGTLTSPYVRRVRIVAEELGIEAEWTDTSTDAGQVALRAFNPLWKVPAAELDGAPLFDSRLICRELFTRFGPGPLAALDSTDARVLTLIDVIDGALDSLINAFYLAKDGVKPERAAYLQKQHGRAASALSWLEQRTSDAKLTASGQFGFPEICLISALDWIRFRDVYDLSRHPRLVALAAEHASRPSVAATLPSAA